MFDSLKQGSQTQTCSGDRYGQFKSWQVALEQCQEFAGLQDGTSKSCVYFKMHNSITFRTLFIANFLKICKKCKKTLFALIFINFLFLKTVGGPHV
jgi:hypothetical protein